MHACVHELISHSYCLNHNFKRMHFMYLCMCAHALTRQQRFPHFHFKRLKCMYVRMHIQHDLPASIVACSIIPSACCSPRGERSVAPVGVCMCVHLVHVCTKTCFPHSNAIWKDQHMCSLGANVSSSQRYAHVDNQRYAHVDNQRYAHVDNLYAWL
jgi:hypothetical protein